MKWLIVLVVLFLITMGGFIYSVEQTHNHFGLGTIDQTEIVVAPDVTTEDAIAYLVRGQEILTMGLEAFELRQSSEMALVLAEMFNDYAGLHKALCEVEGTEDACISASNTMKLVYNALSEFSNQ